MKTGRYTISDLFQSTQIEQIIIPEIQRDYVWGSENTSRLLECIVRNFKGKQSTTLEIAHGGVAINEEINKYLSREYDKLVFNTRIGFIYAYHSPEYSGKYFLIDGQQRLTTIFLMLMAAYRLAGAYDAFMKKYFPAEQPKIDYQVRETSHDFLIDFIKFLGTGDDAADFAEHGSKFYGIYSKDRTAQSMLRNFKLVYSALVAEGINAQAFVDYLENYIEFNYFDTNMTDQGEKLYLYMNSRGESLTDQELVKSVIVGRSDSKTQAGRDWEEWQNFFWRHREGNHNADKGFLEFLKWCVILHMNTTENPKLKPKREKQTDIELREDYIKRTEKALKEQPFLIREYIRENTSFDAKWVKSLMQAVMKIEEWRNADAPDGYFRCFVKDNWLSATESVIDYLPILATMLYMAKTTGYAYENVLRLGMYAKNMEFGFDNRRNPDRATLRAIELAHEMAKRGVSDVRELKESACCIHDTNIVDPADLRFNYLQGMGANAWEEFFWSIVKDKDLNHMLRGNANFIIRLFEHQPTIRNANEYLRKFREKILAHNKSDKLRCDLLRIKDVSLYDGTSTNFGMERWSILSYDADLTDWHRLMRERGAADVVRQYLDKPLPEFNDDYRGALARSLKYSELKKFLWKTQKTGQPHIVVLKRLQGSEYNSRELPLNILHQDFEKSEFEFFNHLRIPKGKINLHVFFEYKPEGSLWKIMIDNKDNSPMAAAQLDWLKESEWEREIVDGEAKRLRAKEPISVDKPDEAFLGGCRRAKVWLDEFIAANSVLFDLK